MGEAILPRYSDDDRSAPMTDGFSMSETDAEGFIVDDGEWIQRFKTGVAASRSDMATNRSSAWSRSYRAYNNRHFKGSKYEEPKYRNRSKIFKPKTRTTVRKNMATAASSLFSTEDVVSISAERVSDRIQTATARFIHEALNFRLDRANRWAGPNWFMTSIGAHQDAQITGVCVTKQYWEYEDRKKTEMKTEIVSKPLLDPVGGLPVVDPMTGAPVMEEVEETYEEVITEVIKDRLMIVNIPSEHVFMDTAADWRDPIQTGGFLFVAHPMRREDVASMVRAGAERNAMGGSAWRQIDVEKITRGAGSEKQQAAAVRRAREDGTDRYESNMQGKDDQTIWLYECFYRVDGVDYHWWMLGEGIILSDPQPTEQAYPEQFGDRPYVRGVGAIETHKAHPMSVVESLQPLQMEINDIVNLRLDAMKMGISPITLIKRGAGVDFKQLQNRGPDASILVNNVEDINFQKAPDPSQNSIMDINIIANDMDDLGGVFSGASVQSNRTLNETVGGMKMLSENANAVTEFDLRVWNETWLEPCLRQCVNAILYYESDETVISVAGEAAGLIMAITDDGQPDIPEGSPLDPQMVQEDTTRREGAKPPPVSIEEVLGNLDKAQLQVRVNIGLGAMNSGDRINKLMGAIKMTGELAPLLKEQGVELNAIAATQEIWGLAGYKDGDRFFVKAAPPQNGPPPEAQMEMLKQKGKKELTQLELSAEVKVKERELDIKERELMLKEKQARAEALRGLIESANPAGPMLDGPTSGYGEAEEPEEDEDDAGEERHGQMMELLAGMMQTMQQQAIAMQQAMAQQMQSISQQNQMIAQQLAAMAQASAAPVEIVRDEKGRMIGGRKVL